MPAVSPAVARRSPTKRTTPTRRGISPNRTGHEGGGGGGGGARKGAKKEDLDKYHHEQRPSSWRSHATVTTYQVAPRGRRGCFPSLGEAISYADPYCRIEVHSGSYFENVIVSKPVEIVASPACEEPPCFHSRGVTFLVQSECFIEGLKISTADSTGEGVGMRVAQLQVSATARALASGEGLPSMMMMAGRDEETAVPKIVRCEIDSIDVCGKSTPHVEDNRIIRSRRTGIQVLDEAGGVFKGNAVEEHDHAGLIVNTIGHCEFTHNKFSKSLSVQVVVHGRKTERDAKSGVTARAVAPIFRYNRFCDDPVNIAGGDGAGGIGVTVAGGAAAAASGGGGAGGAGGKGKGASSKASLGSAAVVQMMPLRTTDDLVCLIPAHEKNRHVDMEEWDRAEQDEVLDRRAAVEVYNGAEPVFDNNMFMQSVGMGLRVHTGGRGVYRFNRFKQNRTFGATFEGDDTTALFVDNIVADNGLGGVRVRDDAYPRIEGNDLIENKGPQLIVMRGCARMQVLYNTIISAGRVGAVLKSNAAGHFVGNIFRDTHIGLRIEGYSSPTFSTLLEGKPVLPADRRTSQVDRDDVNRFQQCYIGVACTRNAYGVFDETEFANSRACAVMLLTDARTTFHRCRFNANDHSVLVQRAGRGTFTGCFFRDNHLATVLVKERGCPTFQDCHFLGGQEDAVIVSDGGLGRFTRNFFSANKRTHFTIRTRGDPEVHQNLMVSSGKAAVMVCDGGAGQITENLICANYEDGVLIETYGKPTVRNNVIRGNHGAGVNVGINGDGIIEKNEFMENVKGNAVISGGGKDPANAGKDDKKPSTADGPVSPTTDPVTSPTSPGSKSVTFDGHDEPAAPSSPTSEALLQSFGRLDSGGTASEGDVTAQSASANFKITASHNSAATLVQASLSRLHSKGFVVLRRNWFMHSNGGGVLCSAYGRCVLVENIFDQEGGARGSAVRVLSGGLAIAIANQFQGGSGLYVGDDGHCVAMMNTFRRVDGPAIVLHTGSRAYVAWNTIEDCAIGITCSGGGGGACWENVLVRCGLAAMDCRLFSRTTLMGNVVLHGGVGVAAYEKAKNRVHNNFFYGVRVGLECMGDALDGFHFADNLVFKCLETGVLLRGGAAQIARNALISNPTGILVDGDAMRAGIHGGDFAKINVGGTCNHFGVPTVHECYIVLGKAIRVRGKGKVRVERTVIQRCSTGIDVTDVCTPILKDCVVTGCLLGASFTAHGGCEMATCVLSRNVRNVLVGSKAVPLMSRCLFSDADYFNVVFDEGAGGTMLWCVVRQAVRGGGIYVGAGSTPTIQRCIVRAHTLNGTVSSDATASTLNLRGAVTERRAVRKSFVGRASVFARASSRRHETFQELRAKMETSAIDERDLLSKSMITGAAQALLNSSMRGRAASLRPGASAAAAAAVAATAARANTSRDTDKKGIKFNLSDVSAESSFGASERPAGSVKPALKQPAANQVRRPDGLAPVQRQNTTQFSGTFVAAAEATSRSGTPVEGGGEAGHEVTFHSVGNDFFESGSVDGASKSGRSASVGGAGTKPGSLREMMAQSVSGVFHADASAVINQDNDSDRSGDDDEVDAALAEESFEALPPLADVSRLGEESSVGAARNGGGVRAGDSDESLRRQPSKVMTALDRKAEESFFCGRARDAKALGEGLMLTQTTSTHFGAREQSFANVFADQREAQRTRRQSNAPLHQAERGGFRGSGLAVDEGGRPRVSKCRFIENNVGVIIRNDGDPVIEDCSFEDNLDHGLLLLPRAKGTIKDCKFSANRVYQCLASGEKIVTHFHKCVFGPNAAEGLRCEFRAAPHLEECTFVGCTDAGVMVTHHSSPVIERCRYDDCCIGVIVVSSGGIYRGNSFLQLSHCGALVEEEIVMEAPVFEDNTFRGCRIVGVRVTNCSDATILNNRIHENGIGVEISDASHAELQENKIFDNERQGVIISNESSAHIMRNIFRANKQGEIAAKIDSNPFIAENTFTEAEGEGISFLMSLGTVKCNKFLRCHGNAIVVRGGSSLSNTDESNQAIASTFGREASGVGAAPGGKSSAVVGFSASAVKAERSTPESGGARQTLRVVGNLIADNYGVGITVSEAADAVDIESNVIVGNGQGGIVVDSEARPRIQHNLVKRNRYRGIRVCNTARPEIRGNVVSCTSPGSCIVVESGAVPQIACNVVLGGADGGIRFSAKARGTALGNLIAGCTGAAIVVEGKATPTLQQNMLFDCDIGVHWRDGGGGFLVEAYVTGVFNIAGFYIERGCAPKIEACVIHDLHRVPGIIDHSNATLERVFVLGCAVGVEARAGARSNYNELRVVDCVFGIQVHGGHPTFNACTIAHNARTGIVVEKPPEEEPSSLSVHQDDEPGSPLNATASGVGIAATASKIGAPAAASSSPKAPAGRASAKTAGAAPIVPAAPKVAGPRGRGRGSRLGGEDSSAPSSPRTAAAAKAPPQTQQQQQQQQQQPQPPQAQPAAADTPAKRPTAAQRNDYGGTFTKCRVFHSRTGVAVEGGTPTFEECDVYWHFDGLSLGGGSPNVLRCNVYDNHNNGIHLRDSEAGVVRGNVGFDNHNATLLVDGGGFVVEDNRLFFPKDGGALVLRGGGQGTGVGNQNGLAAANLAALSRVQIRGNTERNKYDNVPFEKSKADRSLSYQQYRLDAERHSQPFRRALRSFESGCMQAFVTTLEDFGWWQYVAPPPLIQTPAGTRDDVVRLSKAERDAAAAAEILAKHKLQQQQQNDGGETPQQRDLSDTLSGTVGKATPGSPTLKAATSGSNVLLSPGASPLGSTSPLRASSLQGKRIPTIHEEPLLTEAEQHQKLWMDPELAFILVPPSADGAPPRYRIPPALRARADVGRDAAGGGTAAGDRSTRGGGGGGGGGVAALAERSTRGGPSAAGNVDSAAAASARPFAPPQQYSPGANHNTSVSDAVRDGNEVAGWFMADAVQRVEELVRSSVSTSKAQAAAANELLGASPPGAAASLIPMSPQSPAVSPHSADYAQSQFQLQITRTDAQNDGGAVHTDGDDDDNDSDLRSGADGNDYGGGGGGSPESPTAGGLRSVGLSWGSGTRELNRKKTDMALVRSDFAASIGGKVSEVQSLAQEALKDQVLIPTEALAAASGRSGASADGPKAPRKPAAKGKRAARPAGKK